jgi:hypothetical protein
MVVVNTLPQELQQIIDESPDYKFEDYDKELLFNGYSYCYFLLYLQEPQLDETTKQNLVSTYIPLLTKAYKFGIEAKLRNISKNIDERPHFLNFSSIMNEAFSYLNEALESDQFYKHELCLTRADMFLSSLMKNAFLDGQTYATTQWFSKQID